MLNPTRLNELNEAEEPAKELFRRLSYIYVPRQMLATERDGEREVLLKGRLRQALLRLNPWITEVQAERAIFKLKHVDSIGMARNQAIHEYLIYGMPLDVDEPGGRRTRTVHFFDFDHPAPEEKRNEYIVTTQMRVRRGNERDAKTEDDEKLVIPDLVLFVNGIPLVVMEAKSPTFVGEVWRARAVRQLLRYQEAAPEWHGRGAPELFGYNLACVALAGRAGAAYGSIGATENLYAAWKSVSPYTEQEIKERFGVEPIGQSQLLAGMLSPVTLLDILRDFVVFEPEQGRLVKKLPRYQQYRAVTAAIDRILRYDRPEERGGVVWHTQGSGKSLTMLWLAVKLRRESRLQNPTIVIVTDRMQLDLQIAETFTRCGFPAPERAKDTSDLREKLMSGSGRTIFTTIQKFEEAHSPKNADQLEYLNTSDNLVVMVDEAHRTQYGLLGARMSKALPHAVFIGFTGTPIDKGFRRSTMRRFGPLIDPYTIPESVADGATVPIYYEARLPNLTIQGPNTLDKLFETMFANETDENLTFIRRRYATKEALAEADRRIEMIAFDVAEHFKEHVWPNGFKAQLVAPSRKAAMKYAELLNDFGVSAYPIITTSKDDGAEFKVAKELPQEKIIGEFKDPGGEPKVLVVVDMLLTGFDAPVEQVLYLDRGLREHGLLQAIARVNRPCTITKDGVNTGKEFGLVVDYWGVSKELELALAEFDERDREELWREMGDPVPSIEFAANEAESHFQGCDLNDSWACVQVFAATEHTEGDFRADAFERFSDDYRQFSSLLDRFLPDPGALKYVDRLARLTEIRSLARATFLRQDSTIDWDGVSAKVKKLIDNRINAEVLELMKPVSILDENFEAKIRDLPHEDAKASIMEHALRAQITERVAENPAFYEKLSEQLERIIAQMRQHLIDAATAVKEMSKLRLSALSLADIAMQQGLSEVSFAVYELLERTRSRGGSEGSPAQTISNNKSIAEEYESYRTGFDERLKEVALAIESVMTKGQAIVDWQNKEDVQRIMRRDIKRELRKVPGFSDEELNVLAASMVEIARRKLAP